MVRTCYMCRRRPELGSTRSYHRFPENPIERKEWFKDLGLKPSLNKYLYLCSDHFDEDCFYTQPLGKRILKKRSRPRPIKRDPDNSLSSDSTESDDETVTTSSSSQSNSTVADTPEETSPLSLETTPSSSFVIKSEIEIVTEPLEEYENIPETSEFEPNAPSIASSSHDGSTTLTAESEEEYLEHNYVAMDKCNNIKPIRRRRNPRYMGDCLTDDMDSPEDARRNWHIAKMKISSQDKKIKLLQRQNRRLREQVAKLKSTLEFNESKKIRLLEQKNRSLEARLSSLKAYLNDIESEELTNGTTEFFTMYES